MSQSKKELVMVITGLRAVIYKMKDASIEYKSLIRHQKNQIGLLQNKLDQWEKKSRYSRSYRNLNTNLRSRDMNNYKRSEVEKLEDEN